MINIKNIALYSGIFLIILSFIITPKFIGYYFSADKNIDNYLIEFEIYIIDVLFFILGILLIFRKSRNYVFMFLRKHKKDILLLFLALVFMMFASEIILRIYNLQINRWSKLDKTYHHVLVPNSFSVFNSLEFKTHYSVNSYGWRDREYSLKKPLSTFRILMLGDSYTEGVGVESNETFSKLLESRLNSELNYSNMSFEVINTGVSSWSTKLYYLLIKNRALPLEPDLIIINFDNNDISGDIALEKVSKYDDKGDLVAVDGTINNPDEAVLFQRLTEKKSYLFDAIKKFHFMFTKNNAISAFTGENFGEIFMNPNNFTEESCFKWHYNISYVPEPALNDLILFTRDNYPKEELKHYEDSLNYAVKANNLLKEKNISFIFTTYPYGHQVNVNQSTIGRMFRCAEPGKVYSIESCSFAENYLTKQNVSVFNTCSLWRKYNGTEKLFYDLDGHFNVNGHKFMADLYFEKITLFFLNNRNPLK